MSAGYSKRSLGEKLGIRPGSRVGLVHAPRGYERMLAPSADAAKLSRTLRGTFDLVQAFATDRAALDAEFPKLARAIASDGALWISWPKKTSGVASDLDENAVRAIGLAHGLVDVKVCAVDDTWSGLKFVIRLADRPDRSR